MRKERRIEQYLYVRETTPPKGEVKRRYFVTFTCWDRVPRKWWVGTTLEDARGELAVLLARNRGRFDFAKDRQRQERERANLGEWIEEYKAAKAAKRDLPKEVLRFKVILGHFGQDCLLSKLGKAELEKFRTWLLQNGRSKSTANRYLQLLTAVLSMAEEKGKLARVPRLKRFKEPDGRERTLTLEEYERLLAECPEYLGNLVVCAWETGMRRGEIVRLRRRQVNLRDGIITLEAQDTKTDQRREVPISPILRALLLKCVAVTSIHDGAKVEEVFLRDGRPMRKFPRTAWELALKRAGITDLRFHDLRHCFITRKVREGFPQKWIMAITGHKTTAVFNRYTNPSREDKLAVVGAASRLPLAYPRTRDGQLRACASEATAVNSRG